MVGFGILDQSVYLNQFHAPVGIGGNIVPHGDSTQWRLLVASKKSYFQASVEKW
jgi:hypothetical protein